jgi:hypothetical protein
MVETEIVFAELMDRKITSFPPWGELNIEAHSDLLKQPGPPDDWKPIGVDPSDRRNAWDQFLKDTLDVINRSIWPTFDFAAGDWPAGTLRRRHQITAADLSVMLGMQSRRSDILSRPIRTPVSSPAASSHFAFFLGEDNSLFGDRQQEYDATLPQNVLAGLSTLMVRGFVSKSGATSKQLKRHLQRPRAYQMAKVFGIHNFRYQVAITADTPSIVSGHAQAGMIMGGSVIDSWISGGVPVGPQSFAAMQQYAVDIGDRRVMAGVHYPSDNISSWILSLRMADAVFTNAAQVKQHLWTAITTRSLVYRKIERFRPAEVYEDALNELAKLDPARQ